MANVYQTFAAREDLYEGTHSNYTCYLTGVYSAYLNITNHTKDDIGCLASGFLIDCSDEDLSILLNIDLSTGVCSDLLDGFATRADNRTNLLRVDFDGEDRRSELGEVTTWGIKGCGDLAEDLQASLASLLEGLHHNFARNTLDLGIHLNGGNAFCGTGNLKVHVSGEVFHSLNISKNGKLITEGHKAHGDTGNRCLDLNTSIHQREGGTADAGHGGGAIGFQNFALQKHCVGEICNIWQNGHKGALCKGTVADFAATGSTHLAALANRERREVVIVHVALLLIDFQVVYYLSIRHRAES